MALTATATIATKQVIIRSLSMHKPVIVSLPPVNSNIIYSVMKKKDIEAVFTPICDKIKEQGQSTERIIIFCRKYSEVTTLYFFFKRTLKEHFTFPTGSPDLVQNRVVDMYTSCTHSTVKDQIVERFTRESSLRVVIGTIAFGMGVNCPDIRQILHWGISEDVEMYIQESGRAGRDKKASSCVIMYGRRDLDKRATSKGMIAYCLNEEKVCRRVLLFSEFESYNRGSTSCSGCKCCDVCRVECNCNNCTDVLKPFYLLS